MSFGKWRPFCLSLNVLNRNLPARGVGQREWQLIQAQSAWCSRGEHGCMERHNMDTFSVLLALCEGNPPVNDGLPPSKHPALQSSCFLLCSQQPAEKTVKLPVIWDAITVMRRHCDGKSPRRVGTDRMEFKRYALEFKRPCLGDTFAEQSWNSESELTCCLIILQTTRHRWYQRMILTWITQWQTSMFLRLCFHRRGHISLYPQTFSQAMHRMAFRANTLRKQVLN